MFDEGRAHGFDHRRQISVGDAFVELDLELVRRALFRIDVPGVVNDLVDSGDRESGSLSPDKIN